MRRRAYTILARSTASPAHQDYPWKLVPGSPPPPTPRPGRSLPQSQCRPPPGPPTRITPGSLFQGARPHRALAQRVHRSSPTSYHRARGCRPTDRPCSHPFTASCRAIEQAGDYKQLQLRVLPTPTARPCGLKSALVWHTSVAHPRDAWQPGGAPPGCHAHNREGPHPSGCSPSQAGVVSCRDRTLQPRAGSMTKQGITSANSIARPSRTARSPLGLESCPMRRSTARTRAGPAAAAPPPPAPASARCTSPARPS
jgi:hypothetical protein